ncbi:ATP-grasp ribosomal peptide maturase [Kribbella albertanoniae]|uniref:ATP-grasp ribosomal peptide maturase n=1 Tax=Kribbella albertanoniae TaxID=1266829 RepID=A0A4R4QDA4_9ACTN|nr:ATP-grasp ribosomal peptide maturase [Kribbella albertanoniae]TDC33159.1 ATP-grasp ribosomal peptide maturase [Kribbella albertanoniae]
MPGPTDDRPAVLIVTEVDDPTADLVIAEVNRRGLCQVVRVDPGDFPHDVVLAGALNTATGQWRGELRTPSRLVDLAGVRAVYWRRPSPYKFPGLSKQDQDFAAVQAKEGFGGVLAGLDCRYVNHPHCNWVAEYKPGQLSAAVRLGFEVPATLITSDLAATRAFVQEHAPVVYKPLRLTDLLRNGRPLGLWTQRVEPDEIDETVAGTAHLFQAEVVDKVADLRITVVGDRVFCVRIESAARLLDWRADYDALSYKVMEPPARMVPKLQAYLKEFGLKFGCFDFAVDRHGTPHFLECNPNGQWAWMEPPTGLPMAAAFADALEGRL